MQPVNLLYDKLAQYYDVIYAKKNFSGEAKWIYNYLKNRGLLKNASLLDIACGTGRHIAYWQKFYQCIGVDISRNAIKLAQKRVPDASFFVADMQKLQLDMKFDIVACLFGSIAYARALPKLKKTLQTFSAHIKTNGFLVIEPWISLKDFVSGLTSSRCFETEHGTMHRLSLSHKRANGADIEEHYLISSNGNIKYYNDVHSIGLFDITTICNELKHLDFHVTYTGHSALFHNGIIIARKL